MTDYAATAAQAQIVEGWEGWEGDCADSNTESEERVALYDEANVIYVYDAEEGAYIQLPPPKKKCKTKEGVRMRCKDMPASMME